MKRDKPNPKANRSILFLTYAVAAVFVGMIGYFGYFLQIRSETLINNSYNARLERFSDRVIRGELLSADGEVLARSEITEDGSERRVYPYGNLFAHVVGYSNRGKTGLESLANFYLLTSHINLAQQVLNQLSGRKDPGDRVITTLDTELQKTAAEALGDRNGAVIAMEPGTGRILAMVSKPDFDPNTLSEDWDFLVSEDNDRAQLLNRATQGLYPPGSIFKIIPLLEYIREHPDDWRDYSFDCSGSFEDGEYRISCYHGNEHGHQNIGQAFANSCNGAFASLGLGLDHAATKELTEKLMFNRKLPLSMAYSMSSYTMGAEPGDWEVLQTSIGQGSTQITPIHAAMLTCAIAHDGVLMKPYLIDRVESDEGETVKTFAPAEAGSLLTEEEAGVLGTAMEMVVAEGTGSALRTDAYTAAGKTGSAEFETGKETHAWFTGYAPAEDPKLAVTVLVEEGGSGGKTAAPIARELFDRYLSR